MRASYAASYYVGFMMHYNNTTKSQTIFEYAQAKNCNGVFCLQLYLRSYVLQLQPRVHLFS